MTNPERHVDAVVVGSGFGGSIAALRLAEAGRDVLVLERGRRYQPGGFPRDVTDNDALFWRYPRRPASRGLYELAVFSDIGVVVSSGVGGGSLIYANVHIRPDARVFDDPRWPRSYTRASLEPYFDRVAQALKIAPPPADLPLPKRDAFHAAALRLGRPVFDPPQAVAWADPGVSGRQACQMLAQCEFGCPVGAKSSLDLTVLARAEALGAKVEPEQGVTYISALGRGYRVHIESVSDRRRWSVRAERVVVAAGTLGTAHILFNSRDRAAGLPRISARLGHGFSGNGDFLGSLHGTREALEPWRGPDVTSVMRFDDTDRPFTLAAPTFNEPVMRVLASLGQRSQTLPARLQRPLWRRLDAFLYLALRRGWLSAPLRHPGPQAGNPAHMTNLFAIGSDNANGRMELRRGRLDIFWNYEEENRALVASMLSAFKDVAEAYGGSAAPLVTWPLFKRILTVHPLGGCHLSDTPETGVVSPEGEVHGHPGLYVSDGSVIPTSLGFHPVMTIAAVAERISDAVVASFAS